MKKIIILFLILYSCFLIPNNIAPVFAAKIRIRTSTPLANSTGLSYSYVKLRSDRLGIIVNFLNLSQVKQISYSLFYNANGIDQGVSGAIIPTEEQTVQRELLFATCSKGVCTWHTNIKNMSLTVKTTSISGKISTKIYRIKP